MFGEMHDSLTGIGYEINNSRTLISFLMVSFSLSVLNARTTNIVKMAI